jgi:hypothetical protein
MCWINTSYDKDGSLLILEFIFALILFLDRCMTFFFNAKMQILIFRPRSNIIKKLFILIVNNVLCYFPKCAFLQRDQQKIGKNLDVSKLEIRAGVQDFLSRTFEHF